MKKSVNTMIKNIIIILIFFGSALSSAEILDSSKYSVVGKCSGSENILKGEGFIYFLGQRDRKTNAVNLDTIRIVSEIAVENEDLTQDYPRCSYPNFTEGLDFLSVPAKVDQEGWHATWTHPLRGDESSGHLSLGTTSLDTGITNSTWSKILPSYAFCAFGLNLN